MGNLSNCKEGGYGGGQGGYGQQGGYGGYDQGGYGARTIDNYMPRDTSDCIYVNGLPVGTQKSDISNHFCRAGTILVTKGINTHNFKKITFLGVQRIFVFMDKQKVPTGDCTVTYENSESAARAIEMFNNKDFNGSLLQVTPATPEQKQPFANKLVSLGEIFSVLKLVLVERCQ